MASTSPRRELAVTAGAERPAGPAPQGLNSRPSRQRLAVLLVPAAALAFYLWTAATSAPFDFSRATDVYNLMTTAFLHGHSYLPLNPPAGLLHLHDPYDPAQNAAYQGAFHDLALRHGRLYSTWGPSPALLFALFRLTPWDLSQSFAAALYSFVGLACAVTLLHVLVRRWLPDTPGWLLLLASAGLALTNAVPYLLRRPIQYEVAISGGYCFEMAGILLVVTAVLGGRARLGRLATGSLLLGLALAARPTLAVGGLAALGAALWLARGRGGSHRVLLAALVPIVVCGLALGLYNAVRFGSPAEFGQHYQLAGLDVQHKPTDQLSYVPPGVFGYLIQPAHLSVTFPHAFLSPSSHYPFALPAGYAGTATGGGAEPVGGMLTTMPITLLLFALPFLWLAPRRSERPVLLAATGLAGLSLAVIFLLSYALWGTTQRYEVDFATFGLLAAFLVWALLLARARARRALRATIVTLGVALTLIGAGVGTAVSFTGYYNLLQVQHPGTFNTLEDITSPFVTLATIVAGHPALGRVSAPASVEVASARYGEPGGGVWLGSLGPATLTVIAPGAEHRDVLAPATAGAGAPALSALHVRVTSPGHTPVTVGVSRSSVRLPVFLHLGLNRISLSLSAPAATTPQELFLGPLTLGR